MRDRFTEDSVTSARKILFLFSQNPRHALFIAENVGGGMVGKPSITEGVLILESLFLNSILS